MQRITQIDLQNAAEILKSVVVSPILSRWINHEKTEDLLKLEQKVQDAKRKACGDKMADPLSWEILRELFLAKSAGQLCRVKNVTVGRSAPETTMFRRVKQLVRQGMIVKQRCLKDNRVTYLALTEETEKKMHLWAELIASKEPCE